ncbi:MAG: glycoside hydrolase family 15 protein [Myxococcales bacterium]
MPSKIEDYGLIGDTQTCALVSRGGAIDWFCAPSFDSDACFVALLGNDEHGTFAIRPAEEVRQARQRYRGDTLILETEFECERGKVRLIDFMPVSTERCDIVRIVEGLEGEVAMEVVIAPRFAFGKSRPWVEFDERGVTLTAGPDALRLSTTMPLSRRGPDVEGLVTVRQGERIGMTLTWFPSYREPPERLNAEQMLAETERYWREWSGRCTYGGMHREAVMRSLLTLKALTYGPTGGIVAAPTTSLPEEAGGVRNWDYRFCWLRDATLTLHALMIGGYGEEADGFRRWLARAAAGDPAQVQIMYGIRGERRLTEVELDWLPGYENSRPVRLGNDASRQFQLDVYGEVFSAVYRSKGSAWARTCPVRRSARW